MGLLTDRDQSDTGPVTSDIVTYSYSLNDAPWTPFFHDPSSIRAVSEKLSYQVVKSEFWKLAGNLVKDRLEMSLK